jgi:type IV pilus assembly protein PilF
MLKILSLLLIFCTIGCVSHTINSDGSLQSDSIDQIKLSNTYVELALEYQSRNVPHMALDRANLAIANNSKNAKAYVVRALIYQQLNQEHSAEADFKHALALKANYAAAMVEYARFLCNHQRYQEALANFQHALANPLYSTPELAYYYRGLCLANQTDAAGARLDFLQALNYRDPPTGAYLALAKLEFAARHYQLANKYLHHFSGLQDAAFLWLQIKVLQALINQDPRGVMAAGYKSYLKVSGELLLNNFSASAEAHQYRVIYLAKNN